MTDYDVIFVGAGHNALVCAGYAAKAGKKVLVLERRHIVGGAVVTEEIIPGFKFDLGGSAHILIHHTPVVKELELEKYGLEYLDVDPIMFSPYPDGSQITISKDINASCESIAAVSEEDADNYRKFNEYWKPVAQSMVDMFVHAPTPMNMARYLGWNMYKHSPDFLKSIDTAIRSYGQVINESFTSEKVKAIVAWMAAQSGPPPTESFSGPFALWHPMYHEVGIKRPRGGSGMLTQALAKMIQAHGGEIITDAPVKEILSEGSAVKGVRTVDGEIYTARAVASGAHIHTTLRMLDKNQVDNKKFNLLQKSRIGNGFGMMVRYAMSELPNYTALPSEDSVAGGDHHHAMQFICPDTQYLNQAYGEYLCGRCPEKPALIAMTFSSVDKTLAPENKHTLFLWGQYYPYELSNGENWKDIGKREADNMLQTLAEYAPNVINAAEGELIESPLS